MSKEFTNQLTETLKLVENSYNKPDAVFYLTHFELMSKEARLAVDALAEKLKTQNCINCGVEIFYTKVNFSVQEREKFSIIMRDVLNEHKKVLCKNDKDDVFFSDDAKALKAFKDEVLIVLEHINASARKMYPLEIITELAEYNKIGATVENFQSYTYPEVKEKKKLKLGKP